MSARPSDPALFAALQRAVAGRYSLIREVGAGGMGIVYLARDVRLDRPVAIKLLRPALAARPDARARFLAEARLAADLAHPNIVPIHQVEERGDLLWYVMAFVQGRTLGDVLRVRGALPPSEMGRILREVAWALSYAHGRGIVHRDIKPDNIFIEEGGRVLVLDFGIAQRTGEVGEAIGTIGFLPPEQRSQARPDPRSDLYALAITAAATLRARVPADAGQAAAWIRADAPWAAPLLVASLETDPERRPASARLVAEGLTAPVAQPIHPDIRRWVSEADPLRTIAWLWTIFFGFIAWQTAPVHHQTLETSLFFTLLAWPICWGVRVWQTRRVLAQGHPFDALIAAVTQRAESRRQELRSRAARRAPHAGGVVIQIGVGIILVAAYLAGVHHTPWSFLEGMVSMGVFIVIAGGVLHAILPKQYPKQDALAERRAAIWKGPIGSAAAWIAGIGLRSPTSRVGAALPDGRDTEMLLSDSLRELAANLPDGMRGQFAGLEATIDRLERQAARLTERCRRLEAEARATPDRAAALRPALEAARARREEALTSLEALRLPLLAVRGGTADIALVTRELENALELAERVEHLAEARNELRM